MQVRVDGDHGVEARRQQPAEVTLADHLAGREGHVLAHVGQVRADQRQVRGAQFARAGGGQQQFGELGVRLLQAAQQHDARGSSAGRRSRALAVGKRWRRRRPAASRAPRPGACASARFVVKGQQQAHRASRPQHGLVVPRFACAAAPTDAAAIRLQPSAISVRRRAASARRSACGAGQRRQQFHVHAAGRRAQATRHRLCSQRRVAEEHRRRAEARARVGKAQHHRLHRRRRWRSPPAAGWRGTAAARARRRSCLRETPPRCRRPAAPRPSACTTRTASRLRSRSMNSVPALATSQPSSGQLQHVGLGDEARMRHAPRGSAAMSSQDTWLATISVAPGRGAARRPAASAPARAAARPTTSGCARGAPAASSAGNRAASTSHAVQHDARTAAQQPPARRRSDAQRQVAAAAS